MAQCFYLVWCGAGAGDDGAAKLFGREDHFGNSAPVFRDLFPVKDLIKRRHIGKPLVTLAAGEEENADEIFLLPGEKGLAAEEWRRSHAAARDFAFFHCEINFRAP